jgi:hypothetical protein
VVCWNVSKTHNGHNELALIWSLRTDLESPWAWWMHLGRWIELLQFMVLYRSASRSQQSRFVTASGSLQIRYTPGLGQRSAGVLRISAQVVYIAVLRPRMDIDHTAHLRLYSARPWMFNAVKFLTFGLTIQTIQKGAFGIPKAVSRTPNTFAILRHYKPIETPHFFHRFTLSARGARNLDLSSPIFLLNMLRSPSNSCM